MVTTAPPATADAPPSAAPFLLDQPAAWTVERGHVDVFSVRLDGGRPAGRRRHVCRVPAGAALFGTAEADGAADAGRGLLAVPSPGTSLRETDLDGIAPRLAAALVDGWVRALGAGAFCGVAPKESRVPETSADALVEGGAALRARGVVVWVRLHEGTATLGAAATPGAGGGAGVRIGPGEAAPVADRPWLVTDEMCRYTATATADVLRDGDALASLLEGYHGLVRRALDAAAAVERGLDTARLAARATAERDALADGTARLAAVVGDDEDGAPPAPSSDALLCAMRAVGREIGVAVVGPASVPRAMRRADRVGEIARVSRMRVRKVALKGEWWTGEHGPLLGMAFEPDGSARPVALLPRRRGYGRRGYVLRDPAGGGDARVTPAVADLVHPIAYAFYRPFPARALSARDVFAFGLRGCRRDLTAVLLAGVGAGVLSLIIPLVTGAVFQTAIPEADRGLALQVLAALVAVALATGLLNVARGFALLRVESRMDTEVQAAVWDRLLNLPAPFFRRYTTGELATRAGAISSIRRLLSGVVLTSFVSGLFSLFHGALLFYYSPALAMWALALTAVALGVTVAATLVQLRHQRRVQELQSRLQGHVLQFITGLTKLRVAGVEAKAFARWAAEFGEQRRLQFRARRVGDGLATFNAAFTTMATLVIFAVIVAPDEGPRLSTGAFVGFYAAFGAFTGAVLSVTGALTSLLMAVPLYEQAAPILTELPEGNEAKADPDELRGAIEMKHVSFRYGADGPVVLDDVSIRAEPGEFVALVGPSGSGKSTLLRLLLGFERPDAGFLYFDNHDLADVDVQAVRRQMGVVLQSGGLMSGDIFTNIAGATGSTHDDAWAAAKMAGLDEDVRAMPMGMHTVVSEGGTTLSGGQRQRLLIARAIVNRPRVLFFDEATSALDNRTQAIVTESLSRLEATRIVVAHRLSTIVGADRIYVLDKGRVVQEGTYEALLNQPGLFADLAKRQVT